MSIDELSPLTSLVHVKELSDGSEIWVAFCPELGVRSQGNNIKHAQETLREAVKKFLEVASEAEVKQRLAEGFRPTFKTQDQSKETHLEELKREIQIGINQADAGQVAPLDVEAVKANSRRAH